MSKKGKCYLVDCQWGKKKRPDPGVANYSQQHSIYTYHKVSRLQPEQPVLAGDVDELLVAEAPRALVRLVREVRVALLAVPGCVCVCRDIIDR